MRHVFDKHDRMVCGGRNCAKERQETILRAYKALARMNQKGWKIRVWENLGWHFSLDMGFLSVSGDSNGTFSAMMDDRTPPSGGCSFWTPYPVPHFRNPNKAVEAAIKSARQFSRRISGIVEAQEQALMRGGR